jgi:hypothetical protein
VLDKAARWIGAALSISRHGCGKSLIEREQNRRDGHEEGEINANDNGLPHAPDASN